jgi:hypothetical protein
MTSLRIVAFLHPALDVTATDSAGDAKEARHRRRVLPPTPAARHLPGLTKTMSYPKMIG